MLTIINSNKINVFKYKLYYSYYCINSKKIKIDLK